MDTKTIEAIQGQIEGDKDYQKELQDYKKMINLEWDLPPSWAAKEWVRKKVSTDPADSVKMATNIYDTNKPKWDILPMGEADKDNAEELETLLEWWMMRANSTGGGEPFRQAMNNSLVQNRVIYQLDYLPYWLPKDKSKWNKEQKAAMKMSHYCITVHDATNVWFDMGKYGLKWVAGVSIMYAQDIIDQWSVYENSATKEGKKIAAAIAKIKTALADNEELKYVHVDYTSHEKREVSVFETASDSLDEFSEYEYSEGDDKRIDIMDCENKLSFVNWAIVTGDSTPLLYSLNRSGLWENQNLYDTLIDSSTMRRAVFPILQHTSPTGKELDVDYTGEQDVLEMQTGEQASVMMPPSIDPAMREISANNTAKIGQATGIKGLASVEAGNNVQYSAIQAVIKLHMTNLVPYVRTCEKANAQLGNLAFLWLQQGDGFTETGYRTKDKGNGKSKGMGITVSGSDYDFDDMFISCKIVANSTGDKMQEANYYATLRNAGAHIPWKEILENLSEGNGDVLEAEWIDEQALVTALQMANAKLQAELQQKIKQMDMEMQMQAQQMQMQQAQAQQEQMMQQQAPGMPPGGVQPNQGNPMMPEGQGVNAAAGGEPTVTSVPGATSPVQ